MKIILMALLLIGCTDYSKPFSKRTSWYDCSSEKVEMTSLGKHLVALALVDCLGVKYKGVEIIKDTLSCNVATYKQKYCTNGSNQIMIECSAFFLCKKD